MILPPPYYSMLFQLFYIVLIILHSSYPSILRLFLLFNVIPTIPNYSLIIIFSFLFVLFLTIPCCSYYSGLFLLFHTMPINRYCSILFLLCPIILIIPYSFHLLTSFIFSERYFNNSLLFFVTPMCPYYSLLFRSIPYYFLLFLVFPIIRIIQYATYYSFTKPCYSYYPK